MAEAFLNFRNQKRTSSSSRNLPDFEEECLQIGRDFSVIFDSGGKQLVYQMVRGVHKWRGAKKWSTGVWRGYQEDKLVIPSRIEGKFIRWADSSNAVAALNEMRKPEKTCLKFNLIKIARKNVSNMITPQLVKQLRKKVIFPLEERIQNVEADNMNMVNMVSKPHFINQGPRPNHRSPRQPTVYHQMPAQYPPSQPPQMQHAPYPAMQPAQYQQRSRPMFNNQHQNQYSSGRCHRCGEYTDHEEMTSHQKKNTVTSALTVRRS
uniref:Uncharacterized protein n=1 Tax=Magallana gigas TaxID=29159 RepID=A0A8W8MLD3_MAGGI